MAADYSAYLVADAQTSDYAKQNGLINAIQDALNNIGDTTLMTWETGKIILPSQLKQEAASDGQVLAWSTASSLWVPTSLSSLIGGVPSGAIFPWAAKTAPSGYLMCDGTAVSRATYATLFATIVPSLGAVTVPIASPGVFTLASHGLVAGDTVYLTTTGALPTGFAVNTIYYVISAGLTANDFELSATRGGAAINATGSQSGVHTLRHCPYGLGDGTTTFNTPDARGRVLPGHSAGGPTEVAGLGRSDAVAQASRNISHYHNISTSTSGDTGSVVSQSAIVALENRVTTGDSNNLNSPSYLTVNYVIKT